LTLFLTTAVRGELEAWARAGYPFETCGVLIGRVLADATTVERAVRGRNTNRERAHDRYDLDPRDYLAADRSARKAGQEIVGIWHSHPDQPAEPSEIDRRLAWEGWTYLIVEVTRQGAGTFRSWRLRRESFVEEALECVPS
jgi:proteasome lid subunit RPN8/RPN11